MNNKISVIMSTYNEQEIWLKQAIESILTQSFTNFEFIIVLDNPQNQLIEKIVQSYSKKDSRIVIVKNTYNIGLTASLNKALQIATGDYIARMDADDRATKNRLKIQLKYLKTNQLDMVGSFLLRIDENNNIIQKVIKYPILSYQINKQLNVMNCVPHPTWLVKREVYKTLNGYRDIPTCEDYDFLLRAKQVGYKIGNVPKVLLAYRMTFKSISRNNLLKQYLTCRYLQKHIYEINSININSLKTYVLNKNNSKANANYSKAYYSYITAIEHFNKKEFILTFYFLIKCMLSSKWFFIQVCSILLETIKLKLVDIF